MQLVRYIISEIQALWRMNEAKVPTEPGTEAYNAGLSEEIVHNWRPWDHIFAINKIGKGPVLPAYNPHGKYVVKIYWMVSIVAATFCADFSYIWLLL